MPPKTPNNSSNQVLEKKTPMLPAAGTGIYIPPALTNATTTATTMKSPSTQAYPTPATSSSSSSLFKGNEHKTRVKSLEEEDHDILDEKGVNVVNSIPISPLTPEELEQIFEAAADKNDFAKLKQLLNKVTCDIKTIFHPVRRLRLTAVIERTGNMDAIRYLYEVKKVNDKKICIYSLYQNKKFTQETKQYLKSISVSNYTNFYPKPTELHLAVIADDIVKVKEILEKNVIPIDAKDGSGDTALYYAVISDNLAMIELLLDAKANVNIESSTMTKVIHDAAMYGSCKAVQLLIVKGKVDFNTPVVSGILQGYTPLTLAIEQDHLESVNELIANQVDFQAPLTSGTFQGYPPLAIAIKCGHLKIVQELIAKSVDFKAALVSDKTQGLTPLAIAILWGQLEVVKELISNQVDCKSPLVSCFFKAYTPLAMAFEFGHLEIAKELVAKGADFNAAFIVGSYLGSTPLAIAIQRGHLGLVKELIAKGANFKAAFISGPYLGLTPLAVAIQFGRSDIVKELITKGVDCKTKLTSAPYIGFTYLAIAMKYEREDIIKELIANNVDFKTPTIQTKNFSIVTPLFCAACAGKKNIFDCFVPKGAKIISILKPEHDRTALFALVSSAIKNQTFDRNKEMIQYLVKQGVDRDAVCASIFPPDQGKMTVFDIAKDHPKILDCLQTDIERHIKIGILKFETLIEAVATGAQQLPNDRTLHVVDDEKITTGDDVGSFLTSALNQLVSYYDISDVKPYSKYYLNKLKTLKCSASRPFITETSSDHVLTFASTVLSNEEMNDLEAVLQNFLNINRAIFSANLMSSVRDPAKKIKIVLRSSIPSSTASSSSQSVSVPSSSSTSNAPLKNEEPSTKKRKTTETVDVEISSNLTDLFKKTDALIKIPATGAGASPSFFVAQAATASASSSSSQDVDAHTHHKRKREDEVGAGFGNGLH